MAQIQGIEGRVIASLSAQKFCEEPKSSITNFCTRSTQDVGYSDVGASILRTKIYFQLC